MDIFSQSHIKILLCQIHYIADNAQKEFQIKKLILTSFQSVFNVPFDIFSDYSEYYNNKKGESEQGFSGHSQATNSCSDG